MSYFKRILPIIMIVWMAFGVSVFDVEAASAAPGESVSVSFPISKVYGCQGTIQYSNKDILSNIKVSTNMDGFFDASGGNFSFSPSGSKASSGSITVTATIKSSAKEGDTCKVSISNYYYTNKNNEDISKKLSGKEITVAKKVSEKKKEKETSSNKKESEKDSSKKNNNQVEEVVINTDDSTLKKQITIAENLTKNDYTQGSWDTLEAALDEAYGAKESDSQDRIDTAADGLKKAIADLKKVNYSKLEDAIASAKKMLESGDVTKSFGAFSEKLAECEGLLESNNQKEINKAAKELNSLRKEVKAAIETQLAGTTEVLVEVEPTYDYCNVEIHKVWPIAFFVSLVVNFLLLFLFMSMKKGTRRRKDDTPMVNYEICDDDE